MLGSIDKTHDLARSDDFRFLGEKGWVEGGAAYRLVESQDPERFALSDVSASGKPLTNSNQIVNK